MRLYLDDLRPTPPDFDLRAYTAEQAIEMIRAGKVSFISFDHDLGEPENGTGYDVAVWIENEAWHDLYFPMPEWAIHSANPVGARNIHAAMLSAQRALPARTSGAIRPVGN
jgi:hypothetical protein